MSRQKKIVEIQKSTDENSSRSLDKLLLSIKTRVETRDLPEKFVRFYLEMLVSRILPQEPFAFAFKLRRTSTDFQFKPGKDFNAEPKDTDQKVRLERIAHLETLLTIQIYNLEYERQALKDERSKIESKIRSNCKHPGVKWVSLGRGEFFGPCPICGYRNSWVD